MVTWSKKELDEFIDFCSYSMYIDNKMKQLCYIKTHGTGYIQFYDCPSFSVTIDNKNNFSKVGKLGQLLFK